MTEENVIPPAPEPTDSLAVEITRIVLREKNVRSSLPDISDLVASIQAEGVIEPLIGVPRDDGTIELIAGYRRYHAAKHLKMSKVPVRVLDADEHRRHRIALIENLQRTDMNALDKATAIQEMIEKQGIEQREAARLLGVSEGFISQHLTLLKLPRKVQTAVKQGQIELAHARQLARVKDEEKALEFLQDAPLLTSAALSDKVDFYIQKEKEKAAKQTKEDAVKAKEARKSKPAEKTENKSLAEIYAEKKLAPIKKTAMLAALQFYANKLERAEAEAKRAEYKHVLRGLEIAAGLHEFTP